MKCFKIRGLCRLSAACARFKNDCVHQETKWNSASMEIKQVIQLKKKKNT